MAINLVTQPGASAPTTNTDYTQQNELINGALAIGGSVLTDWVSTVAAPDIKQGTFFYHAGNLYEVQSSDYTPSGAPSAGFNYIKLVVSGTTLTASWVTTFSGYIYNPAYRGWYSGTDQIIFHACYKDGTDFRRAIAINNMPYHWTLADGRMVVNQKNILTLGGDIDVGSGDISCVSVNTATLDATGAITADNISTAGSITSTSNISTYGGHLYMGDGTAPAYFDNIFSTKPYYQWGANGISSIIVYQYDFIYTLNEDQNDVCDNVRLVLDITGDTGDRNYGALGTITMTDSTEYEITKVSMVSDDILVYTSADAPAVSITFANNSSTTLASMGISKMAFRIIRGK